jgi:integrase/recombinase XerC
MVPRVIADAGNQAARRFLVFFAATIRNKNTRTAYLHAVGRFFAWCEHHHIGQLADIEPLHVAAYIEALGADFRETDGQAVPGCHPHAVRLAGYRSGRRH